VASGRLNWSGRALVDLMRRDAEWLSRTEDAAIAVMQSMTELAQRRSSVVAEVLPTDEVPELWRHYPADDVHDPVTGAQFYYHCHDAGNAARRARPLPPFVDPLRAESADAELKRDPARLVHLAAVAVNDQGQPVRLFTTNHWVTGDRWMGPWTRRPAAPVLPGGARRRFGAAPLAGGLARFVLSSID
jgi:hypothetical protein